VQCCISITLGIDVTEWIDYSTASVRRVVHTAILQCRDRVMYPNTSFSSVEEHC